ncbi:hypothetical protein WJX82_002775 [Trebouxia sp. C0006]
MFLAPSLILMSLCLRDCADVHTGLANTRSGFDKASEIVKALMACELVVAFQPSCHREAFHKKVPLMDMLAAYPAKVDLLDSVLSDFGLTAEERACVESIKAIAVQQQEYAVYGGRLDYKLLFGLKEPVRWNPYQDCVIGFNKGTQLRRAKLKLAQLHSTEKVRRWLMVDFAVGGLGFKVDIACRLGAQATKSRLACRKVVQLVNCAIDDLAGTRRSGFDPDPEDTYPRGAPSGSAEGHNGSGSHGGASGDHEGASGETDSTTSNSAPSGDHGSGSGVWRGGTGGCDGVRLSLEMPHAEPFDYQQGSQQHSEASQVAYSDCTDCDSASEIPPWEEDSQLLSDSGPQLSVGEQE